MGQNPPTSFKTIICARTSVARRLNRVPSLRTKEPLQTALSTLQRWPAPPAAGGGEKLNKWEVSAVNNELYDTWMKDEESDSAREEQEESLRYGCAIK